MNVKVCFAVATKIWRFLEREHIVKGAAKVRLLTGAGLLDASVVKVDAANDLALLKAVRAFKPLPIAGSRTVKLGGTVVTVGFPGSGFYEEARKPRGRIHSWLHGFLINLRSAALYFRFAIYDLRAASAGQPARKS